MILSLQKGGIGVTAGLPYRSNSNRCPVLPSIILPSVYTRFPDTNVWAMVEENVYPSKGDQPHLDKILSFDTVYGRSRSTSTKSAQYPSRINPLLSIWNNSAVLCAVFCTTC